MNNLSTVQWADPATKHGFTQLCIYVFVWVCMYFLMCAAFKCKVFFPTVLCISMHYTAGKLSETTEHWQDIISALNTFTITAPLFLLASLRTWYILFTQSWSTMEGSMDEQWRKRKEKSMDAPAGSRNRRGIRLFIRNRLREQVEIGREKIKDAATAKVNAYISGAPVLSSISEE